MFDAVSVGITSVGGDRLLDGPLGTSLIPSGDQLPFLRQATRPLIAELDGLGDPLTDGLSFPDLVPAHVTCVPGASPVPVRHLGIDIQALFRVITLSYIF